MRRTIPLTPGGFVLLGLFLSGSIGAGESPPFGPPNPPAKNQATVPAKPVTPSVFYGVCWGQDAKGRYLSAVFSTEAPGDAGDAYVRGRTQVVWKQAFGRYLIKEHNFQSLAQCGAFATKAEAEAYFKQVGPCPRGPGRCVETGWAYTAPAKGPEAALPAGVSATPAPIASTRPMPPRPAAPAQAVPVAAVSAAPQKVTHAVFGSKPKIIETGWNYR
jgi:hypothetical protein